MVRFPKESIIQPGQIIVIAQTAVSFQQQFGFKPDYEITDTDPNVSDMRDYPLWGSGDVGLANDGDEVLPLNKPTILDAINYGDIDFFFAPAINGVLQGQSIERVPANCDSDTAAGWLPQDIPTSGEITFDGECQTPTQVPTSPPSTQPPRSPTDSFSWFPMAAILGGTAVVILIGILAVARRRHSE
jgi:hypothetical protein